VRFRYGGRGLFRPHEADENGLVAVGGSLTTELIIEAYSSGVFPWSSDPVVSWWSPDPRAIFDLATWKPHRSVQKRVRQEGWRFTIDQDFVGVMKGCAERAVGREETWISADFIAAYTKLHELGLAHSVEVWAPRRGDDPIDEGDVLIGGLYGVQLGAFFGGESMFHRRTDASKAAVGYFIERCRAGGVQLLDAQVPNPHLSHLGAIQISRAEYLARLKTALAGKADLTAAS
jgi:leucyl/phenylalanyl-tRNA---protein transferase